MLHSLLIRKIALIDEVYIEFHHGMQVLTGETGAGKSIVVDAVNLILGGRADREMIRSGSERACVEAVFDITGNEAARQFLEREEIEYDISSVTIFREITINGKNICRICGVLIPLSKIKEFAGLIMDLHGQSEHQFLADPESQLLYLDQTGNTNHQELLQKTRQCCELFLSNHKAYAKIVRQNENKEEKIKKLERDLELLKKARIQPGESRILLDKRKVLEANAKKAEILFAVKQSFSGNESEEGCLSVLKNINGLLKELRFDEDAGISHLIEKNESIYYELEELAYQISLLSEKYKTEQDSLEKTDNRLEIIHRLERRFGVDSDALADVEQKTEASLKEINELGTRTEEMSAEHKRLLSEYRRHAKLLTESRKTLAEEFENKITNELKDLGMGNTVFRVEFKSNDTGRPIMPSPQGDDRIEFMISPNPGEPLKPLSKIASGGELSRIMLAIKTIESIRTGVDSMVFDEIDTGISGRMAQAVAEKMITIARDKQVICVTHLPQIAASADHHYLVQKKTDKQRTQTLVTELDQQGRIEEVSRMISGAGGITSEALEYGKRLLIDASEKSRDLSSPARK